MVVDNRTIELKMFFKNVPSSNPKNVFCSTFSTLLYFQMVDCVAAFSILGHRCGGGETHKEHVGDGQKQRENWTRLFPDLSEYSIVACLTTMKYVS